jgi:hypothetical protein
MEGATRKKKELRLKKKKERKLLDAPGNKISVKGNEEIVVPMMTR